MLALALQSLGHGALMDPTTRRGNKGYEDDPVRFDSEAWVCHHANPAPNLPLHPVTAGGKATLLWEFGALHVGDCALYISYDVTLPLAQQNYFKIANLPDCKAQSNQNVEVDLPPWLPGGAAIMRWDWYGVHGGPNNPEFYVQCVDIDITPTASAVTPADITAKFPIIGAYPRRGYVGMTGPACADKESTLNNCALTKDSTMPVPGGTITPGSGGGTPPGDTDGGGGGGDSGGGNDGGDDGRDEPEGCSAVQYTVEEGDTLTSIAAAHPEQQIVWSQICSTNDLANCDNITVGMVLTIPCDPMLPSESAQSTGGGGGGGEDGGAVFGVFCLIVFFGALIAGYIYKRGLPGGHLLGIEAVPAPPPGKPTYAIEAERRTTTTSIDGGVIPAENRRSSFSADV